MENKITYYILYFVVATVLLYFVVFNRVDESSLIAIIASGSVAFITIGGMYLSNKKIRYGGSKGNKKSKNIFLKNVFTMYSKYFYC